MANLLSLGILFTIAVLEVFGKVPLTSSFLSLSQDQSISFQACNSSEACEAEAKIYLKGVYETESSALCQKSVNADYEYNIDLNGPGKEQAVVDANIAYSNFISKSWNENIKNWEYSTFTDDSIKRQLKFLNVIGTAALNDTDLKRYNEILGQMANQFGTAKICPFEKQDCNLATEGLNLDPEIEDIISTSRDSSKLAYVWKEWRDKTGKIIKQNYIEYIALSNKAAEANNLKNNGDLWLVRYEASDFRDQVKKVWTEVKELYDEVYAYVRYKLRKEYPKDIPNEGDPIPAHILGNMWGQTWEGISQLVIPYPNASGFDVTEQLKANFTSDKAGAYQMFEIANKFFMDLGLANMSESYGDKAMIVRPTDGRDVTCHASAWDFCDKSDFRIKMCTSINQEDFITIHHELGHIQYFMKYKDQPITFRDGANPGFHEAIGDVIALSVATPKHMKKLGLIESGELNPETTINYLMQKALEKIAFLPFGYLIDVYRWGLFDGSISEKSMEYEWLKLRNEIEGIIPPVMRNESDFDAGAKYHVPGNTPYIRYFVSFILQFQIHKQLCIAAGQYDPNDPNTEPLYNCDIDGNQAAGKIMNTLLETGFAKNWQDVLEAAIGQREMDPSAIKEYFAPLTDYLKKQREQLKYSLSWDTEAFLKFYDGELPQEGKEKSITTAMIIVGIIQGAGIVAVAAIYVVKTFILKR